MGRSCHFWLSHTWSRRPVQCCTFTLILRISKLDSASKLELAHLIAAIGRLSSTGARMWVKLMVSWGQSQDGCLGPELWSGALLSQAGREPAEWTCDSQCVGMGPILHNSW